MTRTRNGSITGTYDYDADIDAPIFARVMREIAQDLHMIFDSITGENFPASAPAIQVVDHSGAAGAGSLLGMTSWQQGLFVRPHIHPDDLAVYAGNGGSIVLLAKPHWVCDGENILVVEIDAYEDAGEPIAELYDASGALISSQRMSLVAGDMGSGARLGEGSGTWGTIFQVVTTGVQNYIVIRRVFDQDRGSIGLYAWRGYAGRVGPPSVAPPAAVSNAFPVAASGGQLAMETLHDEMFTADYALAGHIPNKLNRVINGLWEYITGAPIPGNTSLTLTYFKEHRRNIYANEPLPQMPLFGEAIGAFGWDANTAGGEAWSLVNTTDPPTAGMVAWHAPYAVAVTESTLHRCEVFMDYEMTGNGFKCTVLGVSEMTSDAFKYTPSAWECRVYNVSDGSGSSWTAFAQVGTLPLVQATMNVPYTGVTNNRFELRLRRSTGTYTFGELAILGWNFYFEP